MMKTCRKCGEEKILDEFPTKKTGMFKVAGSCRKCIREANKRSYQRNKVSRLEWCKVYREKNKEKICIQRKVYREKNKAKSIQACIEWQRANPEKRKKQRERRKDKQKKYVQEWYTKERDRLLDSSCKRTRALDDRYICSIIKGKYGLSKPPLEVIQAKREQLQALRLHKKIQEVLNETGNNQV